MNAGDDACAFSRTGSSAWATPNRPTERQRGARLGTGQAMPPEYRYETEAGARSPVGWLLGFALRDGIAVEFEADMTCRIRFGHRSLAGALPELAKRAASSSADARLISRWRGRARVAGPASLTRDRVA
jgi:hypothetical protein